MKEERGSTMAFIFSAYSLKETSFSLINTLWFTICGDGYSFTKLTSAQLQIAGEYDILLSIIHPEAFVMELTELIRPTKSRLEKEARYLQGQKYKNP